MTVGKQLGKTKLYFLSSLVTPMVKTLPATQETGIRSLGREDPLEKEMATHSSILAWRTPWTEEPGRLQSMGSQKVRHDWVTNTNWSFTFSLSDSLIANLNTFPRERPHRRSKMVSFHMAGVKRSCHSPSGLPAPTLWEHSLHLLVPTPRQIVSRMEFQAILGPITTVYLS